MNGGSHMAKTKHITIHIAGMTCAACSNRVEKVLNRKEGVEANVNLTTEKASINYDPDMVTIEDIKETIERLGYQVAVEKMERSEEHTSELQSRENLVCRLL